MAIVYLGFGSNLGDRLAHIKTAIHHLEKNAVKIRKISAIIETEPVGGPPQNKFLNAVAEAETGLFPQQLLDLAKMIERKLGRKRTVKNGPRTIDIDILLYDRATISSSHLKIPHPQILKRDFIMRPLREIAPDIARRLTYENHSKRA